MRHLLDMKRISWSNAICWLVYGEKECKPNQAGVIEKDLKRLGDVHLVCVVCCSKRIGRQFHINKKK